MRQPFPPPFYTIPSPPYPGWIPADSRRGFSALAASVGLRFTASRAGFLIAAPTPLFPRGVWFADFGPLQSLIRLRTILASPGVLDARGYYPR